MPRKTKELNENETQNKKTNTTKKATTTKTKVAKKSTADKTTITKKTTTKKSTSAKKTSTKKSSSTKKANTKTIRKTSKKTNTTKKAQIVEYYDLPYRYNQTVVKVLYQTPTTLFVYWDISDKDRQNFEKQYGENFFNDTKPILVIHNKTLNYSFEVEINDFANSWYLHVEDVKCDYKVELGRRPIIRNEKLNEDYIYVTTSNQIESPNDRVLFNKDQKMIYFRNVKTGNQTGKSINTISFMRNMGKIYNIYDLYKAIYKDENIDIGNPSSGSFLPQ